MWAVNVYGQHQVKGRVIDADSEQPLPFATVIIDKENKRGVITDIDGFFTYTGSDVIKEIQCSYVGYITQLVTVTQNEELLIFLKKEENSLEEVFLVSGENPALRIIRKVIENRDTHNPKKQTSFIYKSYNKTVFDVEAKDKKSDTVVNKILKGASVFIMESLTERKFLTPDLSHENVIATKVSGFKNPLFASLATNIQPFSFYEDEIPLFDINYLSPITSGSLKKYDYALEETLIKDNDTIHIIAYQPKPFKNFEGLKGVLHINTKGYAVQHVIAGPYDKSKIELIIEQKYNLIDGIYWFPEELNYKLQMPEVQADNILVMEGRSYINAVEINPQLLKKQFPLEVVTMEKDAGSKDQSFWAENRFKTLTKDELRTYEVIDSIGEKYKFDRLLKISEGLTERKIPFKHFDVPFDKLIDFNEFEGTRIGFGLETNETLDDNIRLGGYIGYGFRDDVVKYGGHISYDFKENNDFAVTYSYSNDLIEAGGYGNVLENANEFAARRYLRANFDLVQTHRLGITSRIFKYLTSEVIISKQHIEPQYDSQFFDGTNFLNDYDQSTLSVQVRYAFREEFVNAFNNRIAVTTPYPVIQLSYDRGIDGFLGGDFNYNKIQAAISHSFFTKNVGKTTYRFEGGLIDRPLPYGLLFTPQGSFDREFPVISKNTFQTLPLYTFLSDRYVRAFISHDFGRLLFKNKWLQPNIVVHHNMGIGDIENPEQQIGIPFETMDRWYVESGLELKNILKFNYVDIGYIGLGVGGFYNYGFYEQERFKDNFAFKLNVSFSIN